MNRCKILIIDDDENFAMMVARYFKLRAKYECEVATTVEQAIVKLKRHDYDLITLDINLGQDNGLEYIEEFKKYHAGPIIFVSCLNDIDTRLKGLKMGAEDYLVKPIDLEELYIRAEKEINRSGFNRFLRFEDYTLDVLRQKAYKSERELNLNVACFNLLLLLLKNRGEVMTREELFKLVWNSEYEFSSRVIDTGVAQIRKEAEDNNIKSIRGIGYIYE